MWGIDDERYVDGPGPVTFAVDVPDARAEAERLRAAGHDVEVAEIWLQDRQAGFTEVFVCDLPTWFPFLITFSPPRAEIAAMRAAHRAEHGIERPADRPDLVALLVRTPDPEGDARRLATMLGCGVSGAVVDLPGAEVRFEQVEPGAGAGLHGIVVRGLPTAQRVEIHGMVVEPES